MQSRYFEMATTVVTRHGGTVEKFIGDAVMAVWGTPTAREDDAERAVRAALELVAAVPGLDAGHRGALRRPDRRGGGHARRHEPGHGHGRPREHRCAAAVGGRSRRRSSSARRRTGPRPAPSPSRPRASRSSRARPSRCPRGARCAWSRSVAGAAGSRAWTRRSSGATPSCGCSRSCSTRRGSEGRVRHVSLVGQAGIGKSRAWRGSSRSTSTGSTSPSGGTAAGRRRTARAHVLGARRDDPRPGRPGRGRR